MQQANAGGVCIAEVKGCLSELLENVATGVELLRQSDQGLVFGSIVWGARWPPRKFGRREHRLKIGARVGRISGVR
jgi:hypothetical protein